MNWTVPAKPSSNTKLTLIQHDAARIQGVDAVAHVELNRADSCCWMTASKSDLQEHLPAGLHRDTPVEATRPAHQKPAT